MRIAALTRPLLCLLILAGCRATTPPTVDIVATNYAFQAPRTLSPGPTLFQLVNHGTVNHEVQIYRLRAGISADSGLKLLASSYPDSLADSSGSVLVSHHGLTPPEKIFIDLKAGETWALECAFRDSTTAPRHNTMGMIATFEVK